MFCNIYSFWSNELSLANLFKKLYKSSLTGVYVDTVELAIPNFHVV